MRGTDMPVHPVDVEGQAPDGIQYRRCLAGLPAVSVGVDLAQELADGYLKLLVTALDEFLGLVAYLEVRLKLGVLQIVTVACAVSDDRYSEIHQAGSFPDNGRRVCGSR